MREFQTRAKHSAQHCVWVGCELCWVDDKPRVLDYECDSIAVESLLVSCCVVLTGRRRRRDTGLVFWWDTGGGYASPHGRPLAFGEPLAAILGVPTILLGIAAAVRVEKRASARRLRHFVTPQFVARLHGNSRRITCVAGQEAGWVTLADGRRRVRA